MKLFIVIIHLLLINVSYSQWEQQSFPSNEYLWKVRFLDQQTGWVLGNDYVYKTQNGGSTWINQNARKGFGALVVISRDTVLYSGEDSTGKYCIYRTSNGGNDWYMVDSSGFFINEFEFMDNQTGYAVGGSRTNPGILKTINGGINWNLLPDSFNPDGYEIMGVSLIDSLEGWVVSYRAFIYHTNDGGQNWIFQDSLRQDDTPLGWLPLRDIEFTTPDSGWVAGGISGDAYIAHTIDGGTTWDDSIVGGGSIREIHFLDSFTGWTAGNYNFPPYIWHTQNGGIDWYGQYIASSVIPFSGVESLTMINKNLGWTVGDDGIFKTTSGSVVGINENTAIKNNIPSKIRLEQNYPNPFNPSTTIEFSLTQSGFVELSIYNHLGQIIITVVNEKKEAGKHKITFSAKNLAAGIYYYRLKAAYLCETKKMVIIK